MRRHRVMDIFWRDVKTPVGDWIQDYPIENCKLLVKLVDDTEHYAYYYVDAPKGYHFWHVISGDAFHAKDVKEWKKLDEV